MCNVLIYFLFVSEMANFVILFCFLAITSITAAPASNEQLDKVRIFNDLITNIHVVQIISHSLNNNHEFQ